MKQLLLIAGCLVLAGCGSSGGHSAQSSALTRPQQFVADLRAAHPTVSGERVDFKDFSDAELLQQGRQVCSDAKKYGTDTPDDPDFTWTNTVIRNGTMSAGQAVVLARAAHLLIC